MRWQLNLKIQAVSNKENNLLKNEDWGVCQNIKRYMAGVDGCKSEDVKKVRVHADHFEWHTQSCWRSPVFYRDKEEGPFNTKKTTRLSRTRQTSCRTSQLQTERAASGATARTAAGIKQAND